MLDNYSRGETIFRYAPFFKCYFIGTWLNAFCPTFLRYLEVVQSLAMYSYHYFEVKVCLLVRLCLLGVVLLPPCLRCCCGCRRVTAYVYFGYSLPKDKSGNQLWLGVGPNGIVQCPYENRMDPTMVSGRVQMCHKWVWSHGIFAPSSTTSGSIYRTFITKIRSFL